MLTWSRTFRTSAAAVALIPCCVTLVAQAPRPAPDTLVFANGEQLTGTLSKADAKGITFESPMAGTLTVKWANIRELRSDKRFAVLTAHEKLTRRNAEAVVPQGKVTVRQGEITVATATGDTVIRTKDADRLIDGAAFDKAIAHPPGLLTGFGGTATAGLSLVRQTVNSSSFNGGVSLVRAAPLVDWLPARNRTSVDYTQSYQTTSETGVATATTNIFHANLERDEYFKPRGFAFGSATFDHNSSQFLTLEQAYGGGLGISVVKNAIRQLDVKADVHYEKETFLPNTTPDENLFGSTFSEKFLDYLPKGLVLNEFGSVSPAWNVPNAYSAHVNASLGFPVFRGLGFNVGAVDDYLNNAPMGTQKNSTQFTTGLTFTVKPR